MDSDPFLGLDVFAKAVAQAQARWRSWLGLGLLATAAIVVAVIAASAVSSLGITTIAVAVFAVCWTWCVGLSLASALARDLAAGGDGRLRSALAALPLGQVLSTATVVAAVVALGAHLWLLPGLAALWLCWYAPVLVVEPGARFDRALLASMNLSTGRFLDTMVLVSITALVALVSAGLCATVLPLTFPVLALATHGAALRMTASDGS